MEPLEELIAYCRRQSEQGEPLDAEEVRTLLDPLFDHFWGDRRGGFEQDELDRVHDFAWNDPCLSFSVERHGAFVLGSSRATMQDWALDLQEGGASFMERRGRQMRPMARRVNVRPIAQTLANAIVQRQKHGSLFWRDVNDVSVQIGDIRQVNSDFQQTRQGRRKRLHSALCKLLPESWTETSAWRFRDSGASAELPTAAHNRTD